MSSRHLQPAFAAIAALCCGAATAQTAERPWYLGLSQQFTHESNVYGTSTGEVSDTLSTTTLSAGLNQPFGRQRLYANGAFNVNRYRDQSNRNNNGHTLAAGLDWSTVERLSGSLTFNSQRRQTDFTVGGITPVTDSNIERSDEAAFRARLGVVTPLALELGVGHRRVSFSAPEYAEREYRQDSGNLGVVYRSSDVMSLSAGFSGSKTRYLVAATGQTAPDRSVRKDVYVALNWVPTGASSIAARLAVGSTEFDLGTSADVDGATGSVVWNWRPGSRLSVATSLSRDNGRDSGFQRLAEGTTVTGADFSRVSDRIGTSLRYELTAKVALTAAVDFTRRDLTNAFTGDSGRDETTSTALGARWNVTRTIALGCDVSRERRTSSGIGSSDLSNDRFGCFGSVTID